MRAENSESFRQEAQASWSDYQETGLHLTGHEVHAWLNNWGTDKEEAAHEEADDAAYLLAFRHQKEAGY